MIPNDWIFGDSQWSHPACIISICSSGVFALTFIMVEIFVSVEPVMTPFLLKQRIPVLVGCSNFLVAMCNFSIMYFFPMWFQTVMMTNASTAGMCSIPSRNAFTRWFIRFRPIQVSISSPTVYQCPLAPCLPDG